MKRLLVAVACTLGCAAVQGATIASYDARVDVAADGLSAATVRLKIDDAAAGALLVPLAPALKPAGPVHLVNAPAGTQLKTVTIAGRPHLEVALPDGVDRAVPVDVSFPVKDVLAEPKAKAQGKRSLPEGSLLLDHAFVNTQPVAIASYRVQVLLPGATRVQEIREQSPKTKRTEIEPRVALNASDGRQGAVLQLADVRQGDRASMTLEVVPDRRGPMWLLVGLALAIAYLIGFRDLVSKPGDAGAA